MKNYLKSLLFAAVGVFALASCEDVPAPYDIPGAGNGNTTPTQTSTFYSSTSCSDWNSVAAATGNNPWSTGASYTQATGYQKWEGAEAKSNRMADGYLISPAFKTQTDSTEAYISFQYCVGYANNDAQFADHIKVYVSSQYNAADGFVADKWKQLDWVATHTSTNWELETTTIALPAEFLNQEAVNIAFYFTTPNDTKSATFEITDLKVVAGAPAANVGPETPQGVEVTCAEAVALTNALADNATSSETYTITGYITEVVGTVSRNQQTFWMADTKDGGKVFEAYYANLPEGVTEFKVGAKVKITGTLLKYVNKDGKVTPESKNATVEILEDGGETPVTPSGIEVTCAEAVTLTNALEDGGTSTEVYTITGYITEVVGSVSRNQQTFWMADTKDGGKVFEAYYANLPEGVTAFKVGTKVKITGNLMKYVKDGKVTPEIKNATVEILEDGGDTPVTPTGTEVTCAEAVTLTNALEDGGTSTEVYTVTGYITEVVGNVSRNQQTFWMADTKDGGKVFEAYYANLPEGVTAFKVGSKVKITGNLMKYVNKEGAVTPEIKNANVEILEGGDTPDDPVTPVVSGNSITFSAMGYENAQDFNEQSITVGDAKLTFSKGSGSTTPKYYNTGSAMRLYGGNTLTISSSKTISKVVFTYAEDYNGTSYYPTADDSSVTPGTYDYSSHTWTGSANSIVLTRTATTGHFRVNSVTITYAE